jgi:hypothetical protein
MKQAASTALLVAWLCLAYCLLYAAFLLGLFFDPVDRGDMFLRNID